MQVSGEAIAPGRARIIHAEGALRVSEKLLEAAKAFTQP